MATEDSVLENKHTGLIGMPKQHIRSTSKTPAWGRNSVLAIKNMASSENDMGRSSRSSKQANYDLVNSLFKEEDFDHVINPHNLDFAKFGGTATQMQNYNIIRSRLETLRGEEMNTPLNFFVYAISGEAVSAKKTKKKEVLKEMMKASIRLEMDLDQAIQQLEGQMQQIQEAMQTAQDQKQIQQMEQQLQQLQEQRQNMPDIQAEMKRFSSDYTDPTEQTNNKILKYLKRKDRLGLKFNQGWFHGLVTAEEVYYTGIVKGHPSVRAVNPLQFDYDKGANTTFIHEGNWAREEYWMPNSEIIDMFGDALTDKQVRDISNGKAAHSYVQGGMQQGFAYSFDGGQKRSFDSTQDGISTHGYVMQCAWRSYRKVGMLKYKDLRSGKIEEVEVDDTFVMPEEMVAMNATVDWMWESDIWEGTLIGADIFVNIRPKSNQTKNLPYIGYIYNNVNSIATSMVDLVKSHQYTYIILWWRLEQELAKAKGKKFIMDMAQVPKSMGWDVDKWMYYFEEMGVVWINSREEGRKGDQGSMANFNQFNAVDMTLSQVVGQYMEVMAKLEALVEDIMGVSPQRMGDVGRSETATGAQTAIARSTNVTRPWFYFHDLVKESVLDEILELAKIAYIDGRELELVISEFEVETLKIDGDKLNGSQMGVFVTNSYEDRSKKEQMEGLLSSAVQQGKASLLDIANVLDSDSMSYIKSVLATGEKTAQEQANAQNQSAEKIATEELESERKDKEIQRAHEMEMNVNDNESRERIKEMDVISKDTGDDSVMEAIDNLTKTGIEEGKLTLEKTKEANRKAEKAQELTIKRDELKIKEKEVNIKKSQTGAKK